MHQLRCVAGAADALWALQGTAVLLQGVSGAALEGGAQGDVWQVKAQLCHSRLNVNPSEPLIAHFSWSVLSMGGHVRSGTGNCTRLNDEAASATNPTNAAPQRAPRTRSTPPRQRHCGPRHPVAVGLPWPCLSTTAAAPDALAVLPCALACAPPPAACRTNTRAPAALCQPTLTAPCRSTSAVTTCPAAPSSGASQVKPAPSGRCPNAAFTCSLGVHV